MKDSHFLIVTAVAGLAIGLLSFQLIPKDDGSQRQYCEEIERGIKQNQSFNGSLACYPPGVLNVDLNESRDVSNATELQCVCRRSYMGEEQIFAIRRAR